MDIREGYAKKADKMGRMKAYILADSQTGYLYSWYLYAGEYIIHVYFSPCLFVFFSVHIMYSSKLSYSFF